MPDKEKPLDRHQWWDKFRAMKHDDFTLELRVKQDVNDPELYGMLSEAVARLDHLKHGRDQLYGFFNQTADHLGVIPEQPYILKEIKYLKECEQALSLIREYIQGCNPEAGGVDTAWVLSTIENIKHED